MRFTVIIEEMDLLATEELIRQEALTEKRFLKYLLGLFIKLVSEKKQKKLFSALLNNGYVERTVAKKVTSEINDALLKVLQVSGEEKPSLVVIENINVAEENFGMKLEIDIKELDIDCLLELVLKLAEETTAKQEGEPADPAKALLFAMLGDLNKDISAEEKFRLIQVVLDWLNRSRVPQHALESYMKRNEEMGSKLEALKLNIGDITLKMD